MAILPTYYKRKATLYFYARGGTGRFMSRKKFMLSWAEHEKFFITSGPEGRIAFYNDLCLMAEIWIPEADQAHNPSEVLPLYQTHGQGPSCLKLTTSLFNETLKFQTFISQIGQYFFVEKMWEAFAAQKLLSSFKKNSIFAYKVVKHLTSWSLYQLVNLTMLWTTGPSCLKHP